MSLAGCNLVLFNASGDVARQQGDLIVVSTLLMLIIILPVMALTVFFAWRYRASNKVAEYKPEWDHSTSLELIIWAAPLLIIIALGALVWIATHTLDPYQPLKRIDADRRIDFTTEPMTIEVVALDWKWLFIYPEQGIATVNELAAPIDKPIRFKITSTSVMNSFYIPALAGQIYAMPGMETQLNAVLNEPGVFDGFSANYSGAGFSGMKFKFHGMSDADFTQWVQKNKTASLKLTKQEFLQLQQPSERDPVKRYSAVAPTLFHDILNQCVREGAMCMDDMMSTHAERTAKPFRGQRVAAANAVLASASMCMANDESNNVLAN